MTPRPDDVKPPRPYHSPIRAERALAHRRSILEAAHGAFLADGYARTSVASIAARVGVSEDLVYKHFRNKRGLLVEVLNFAATGEPDSPRVLEQQGPREVRRERDQRRQVAMFSEDVAGRVSRVRPVDDVLRSAAEVDPALAAKRAEMHETRWDNMRAFVGWVAANGPLREGVDVEAAATTVWTLTSPEVHRLLVDVRGWEHEEYAAWLRATIEAALLSPS